MRGTADELFRAAPGRFPECGTATIGFRAAHGSRRSKSGNQGGGAAYGATHRSMRMPSQAKRRTSPTGLGPDRIGPSRRRPCGFSLAARSAAFPHLPRCRCGCRCRCRDLHTLTHTRAHLYVSRARVVAAVVSTANVKAQRTAAAAGERGVLTGYSRGTARGTHKVTARGTHGVLLGVLL